MARPWSNADFAAHRDRMLDRFLERRKFSRNQVREGGYKYGVPRLMVSPDCDWVRLGICSKGRTQFHCWLMLLHLGLRQRLSF